MNARIWAEIVAAYEDCMRAIESAFAGNRIPDLEALHARLWRRLDELHGPLEPELGPDGALLGLAPLTFLVDEQVELRLARVAGDELPEWPQLQSYLNEVNGGDEFYARARALLRQQPPPPQLLVGLYRFCLQAGFQGRLFDDKAAIGRLKEDLSAYLGPAAHAAGAPVTPSFHRAQPAWRSLLVAAGGVLAFQIVLLAIARAM